MSRAVPGVLCPPRTVHKRLVRNEDRVFGRGPLQPLPPSTTLMEVTVSSSGSRFQGVVLCIDKPLCEDLTRDGPKTEGVRY